MNAAELETVFDITQQPYPWHWPAFGLTFVVIGSVWSAYSWRDPSWYRRWRPRVFGGFGAVWTALVFGATFAEWHAGCAAIRENRASMVEGRVENFVPMPFEGHAEERFTVRGVSFSYSDYTMGSAFKNTSSHGGPIRPNLYVRIRYRGNSILKLEVDPKGASEARK